MLTSVALDDPHLVQMICRERGNDPDRPSGPNKVVTVQGKARFFDSHRGFGLLSRDAGEEVFVHVSNLQPGATLNEGQTVAFDVGTGRKSDEANNVPAV